MTDNMVVDIVDMVVNIMEGERERQKKSCCVTEGLVLVCWCMCGTWHVFALPNACWTNTSIAYRPGQPGCGAVAVPDIPVSYKPRAVGRRMTGAQELNAPAGTLGQVPLFVVTGAHRSTVRKGGRPKMCRTLHCSWRIVYVCTQLFALVLCKATDTAGFVLVCWCMRSAWHVFALPHACWTNNSIAYRPAGQGVGQRPRQTLPCLISHALSVAV